MSLQIAKNESEARKRREAIELCGKNRGPHDYIPIEWATATSFIQNQNSTDPKESVKRVTRLLCRVCFCNISIKTLIKNYEDVSYEH